MKKRWCKPRCDESELEAKTVGFSNGTSHLAGVCQRCGRRNYMPKQLGKDAGFDFKNPDIQVVPTKNKTIAEAKEKARNVEVARAFLTKHHFGWKEFSGSHWRIGEVDFWPTTQKSYHRITHQKGQGLSELLKLISNEAVVQTPRRTNWTKFFNENKHQKVNAGFNAAAGLGRKYGLKKGMNKS